MSDGPIRKGDPKSLLCFPVVQPVAELLLLGQWPALLGLGRWGTFTLQLPSLLQGALRPFGHVRVDVQHVCPHRASILADQLREWAPTLLEHASDVEETLMSVEGAVRWLDGLAEALRAPTRTSADIARGTVHYTSLQLVSALLLSRMVKDTSDLAEVAARAFEVVFPALGGGACARDVPERRWLGRAVVFNDQPRACVDRRNNVIASELRRHTQNQIWHRRFVAPEGA